MHPQERRADPRNGVIAAMDPGVRHALLDAAEPKVFRAGQSLPWTNPSRILFPVEGILSVRAVPHRGGEQGVEIAMVGREGMVDQLLAPDPSGGLAVSAMIDGQLLSVDLADLPASARHELSNCPEIAEARRGLVLQMSQATLAAARRTVPERLARWLLMCFDRVDGGALDTTHDVIAAALGVRRPGVTVATHELEGVGAIRTRRGGIRLLDRAVLAAVAEGDLDLRLELCPPPRLLAAVA